MLKVGIFAPYVRNETTLAAVQIADWLIRCGIEVEFLADGKVSKGIHPVWDNKVKRANEDSIHHWAFQATHLCWFSPNLWALQEAKLVSSFSPKYQTLHYYFPYWGLWNEDNSIFLKMADRVICLSHDLSNWLDKHQGKVLPNRTWANLVVSDKLLSPKCGWVQPGLQKFLIVISKSVKLDLGPELLDIFYSLLDNYSGTRFTFLLEHSMPRRYRTDIKQLQQAYPDRVACVTSPPYYDYSNLARQHDWVYMASTRYTYGSVMAALVSSSSALVCHDIPPVGAHLVNDSNGKLIVCGLDEQPAPIAEVSLDDVEIALSELAEVPTEILESMQLVAAEYIRKKQKAFEWFICNEFV